MFDLFENDIVGLIMMWLNNKKIKFLIAYEHPQIDHELNYTFLSPTSQPHCHMSCDPRKEVFGFATRSDINQPIQSLKKARSD